MAYDEVVVFALGGFAVARDVGIMLGVEEGLGSSGEHFMDVALVGYIEDEFVGWGVEDVVEGYGGLDHAEVGGAVATALAQFVHEGCADLCGKGFELGGSEAFDVRGGLYLA